MTRATILIVDDCEINRCAMGSFLTGPEFGYQLHFATSGPEALEMARKIVPDLVLLDVVLPEMDGFEVCRHLRSDPMLAEIPIIMVTALEDSPSRVQGFASGADDFVSKPVHCDELRARVANIVRLNRFRSLLSQRSRFEWVIEQAGDGFALIKSDGATGYANSRARELLSLAPGTPFVEHLRARFECVPTEGWEGLANLKTYRGGELFLVRAETSTTPASWLKVDIEDQGGNNDLVVRVSDVSRTVIERMNAWSLRSMVSHKLRTPLFKLVMSLSMVKKLSEAAQLRPLVEARLAETGIEELRRVVEGIVNNLGSAAPASQLGRADEGLQASLIPPLLEALVKETDFATLSLESPASQFVGPLDFSQGAMEMAVRGLLENAVRIHPGNRPEVAVRVRVDAEGLKIVVEDDGITLSPAQLERALLPYHQGPEGGHSGAGRGLAMVAGLMWEMGGDCRLANRPGRPGLIVELDIPWTR